MGTPITNISIKDTNNDGIVDGNDQVTISRTEFVEKDGKTTIKTESKQMDAETYIKYDFFESTSSPQQKLDGLRDKMKNARTKKPAEASSELVRMCQELMAEKAKVAAK
jgi:hypothetical protein